MAPVRLFHVTALVFLNAVCGQEVLDDAHAALQLQHQRSFEAVKPAQGGQHTYRKVYVVRHLRLERLSTEMMLAKTCFTLDGCNKDQGRGNGLQQVSFTNLVKGCNWDMSVVGSTASSPVLIIGANDITLPTPDYDIPKHDDEEANELVALVHHATCAKYYHSSTLIVTDVSRKAGLKIQKNRFCAWQMNNWPLVANEMFSDGDKTGQRFARYDKNQLVDEKQQSYAVCEAGIHLTTDFPSRYMFGEMEGVDAFTSTGTLGGMDGKKWKQPKLSTWHSIPLGGVYEYFHAQHHKHGSDEYWAHIEACTSSVIKSMKFGDQDHFSSKGVDFVFTLCSCATGVIKFMTKQNQPTFGGVKFAHYNSPIHVITPLHKIFLLLPPQEQRLIYLSFLRGGDNPDIGEEIGAEGLGEVVLSSARTAFQNFLCNIWNANTASKRCGEGDSGGMQLAEQEYETIERHTQQMCMSGFDRSEKVYKSPPPELSEASGGAAEKPVTCDNFNFLNWIEAATDIYDLSKGGESWLLCERVNAFLQEFTLDGSQEGLVGLIRIYPQADGQVLMVESKLK